MQRKSTVSQGNFTKYFHDNRSGVDLGSRRGTGGFFKYLDKESIGSQKEDNSNTNASQALPIPIDVRQSTDSVTQALLNASGK